MKRPLHQLAVLSVLIGSLGCDIPPPAAGSSIDGAEFLTFRCVELTEDGRSVKTGLPLENCGCTQLDNSTSPPTVKRLGRIQCTCVDRTGSPVRSVRPGECNDDSCPPYEENGDWIPAETGVPCVATGGGQIRGYVGSNNRGEVSVLDLSSSSADSDTRVLDVDQTIPGITGIYVEDIVSDVESDPYGRFVFTVNSSSGTLSIIRNDSTLLPALPSIDLGIGPLHKVVTWPDVGARLHTHLEAGSFGWISASSKGEVHRIDLELVYQLLEGEGTVADVLGDCASLRAGADCRYTLGPDHREGFPGQVTIGPNGNLLVVAHSDTPTVTVFDLTEQSETRQIDLSRQRTCPDGYLTNVLSPLDDPTCADGVDNDGDGSIDDEDDGCATVGSEAPDPRCPQRVQCADLIDNDGDGKIDLDDEDCDEDPRWEGAPPPCADGEDNDGDGLIDRNDPGCGHEQDDETGSFEEAGDVCDNGTDDDLDGLTDGLDPGCADSDAATRYFDQRPPECGDGIDNDEDGKTDFGSEGDPDCYAAGDYVEGGSSLEVGPTELLVVPTQTTSGRQNFLYVVDPGGYLGVVNLDDPQLRVRRTRLSEAVLGLALRQTAEDTTVLALTEDRSLRSLSPIVPAPLLTQGGKRVYARYPSVAQKVPSAWARTTGAYGPIIDQFYTVQDGQALRVEGLTGVCSQPSCDEENGCGEDRECLSAQCVPAGCMAGGDCSSGKCVDGACVSPCVSNDDCTEGYCGEHTSGAFCQSRCTISREGLLQVKLSELPDERLITETDEPIAPSEGGAGDPMVHIDSLFVEHHGERNILKLASSTTRSVSAAPSFRVGPATVSSRPDRHAVFCQLPQPINPDVESDDSADAGAALGCHPVGYTLNGERLVVDTRGAESGRLWSRVDRYEGIQVRTDSRATVPSDIFTIAFEGSLPNSTSRTGVFHERLSDEAWSMVDYNVDYCRLGVEAGDVVVVARFTPSTAELAECAPFDQAAQATSLEQRREPFRYIVTEVGPHNLSLKIDERTSYNQVSKDGFVAAPRPATAVPAPSADCASQLFSYHVRAAHEQWLLTGQASGYRHRWVRQGATCAEAADRDDRRGRVTLGSPFENEWFRFHLGSVPSELDCSSAQIDETVAEACNPYMVDTEYRFSTTAGEGFRRLQTGGVLPREMRWLPNTDRLYIVDGALKTVIEYAGFNVFTESMLEIRQLR